MNLAELIKANKGDRSYEALSEDCGGNPRAARLQQLATQPQKNFPDPETLEALALGLRVPTITVVMAAAESFGIDVRRSLPALLDRLPAGVEQLDDQQVQIIVDLARTFVRVNEAVDLQKFILQNLLLDSGVKFLKSDGTELVGPDRLALLIDQLLVAERRTPGRVNEFYGQLSYAAESVEEHGNGQHGISVTISDSGNPPAVDVYKLPAGKRRVGGLIMSVVPPNADELSEPGEIVLPAADDVIPDDDEEPGGSR